MDRDNITRTGARAPGVEREIRSRGGAYKRIVPDTEQGSTMAAEGTKDDSKPVRWEGLVWKSGLEAVPGKTRRTEF